MKEYEWIMPVWMVPYEKFIVNTSETSVTDLMNYRWTDDTGTPLISLTVSCQLQMLSNLYTGGCLSGPDGRSEHHEA